MGESIVTRIRRWFNLKPPALRRLLALNIGIYLAWVLVLGHIPSVNIIVHRFLALNPQLPDVLLTPWQVASYSVLHLGFGFDGLIHIVFNMLWLVWIGQEFEELYGSQRMAFLYVAGAVGGGIVTVFLHSIFPGVPAFGGPVHGASGAVLGLITAVATLQPHKRIGLLFLGVWPLRWIVVGFLIFDLIFSLGSNVSVSAHLGGALGGFLFARFGFGIAASSRFSAGPHSGGGILQQLDNWIGSRRRSSKPKDRVTHLRRVTEAEIVSEVNQSDVDRILDKINEQGYEALTTKEKDLLYEASRE